MRVFRRGSSFLIEDTHGILTPCGSLREAMHVLHRAYCIPVNQLEIGLMDLLNNNYDVAEFGHINGEYLFSGKAA